MKMKHILKRLMAVGTATIMTVGAMGLSAMADTVPTIDTTKDISLTVHKYVTDDLGEIGLDSSVTGKEITMDGYTPLEGVTFSVLKVADLIQEGNATGENAVKYQLNEAGAGAFSAAEGDKKTGKELNDAVKDLTALGLTKYFEPLIEAGSAISETTDAAGTAEFTNAKLTGGQGLYLVVETGAPEHVTKRAVPFLVSLPMTDKEALNDWMYDVHAYPKNTTAITDVEKKITDVEGSADGIAADEINAQAQIGDVITYQVPMIALVPDGGLNKLGITDVMSKGLTFKTSGAAAASTDVKVYAGDTVAADKLIPSDNYTVKAVTNAEGVTNLGVYFTEGYINETINKSEDKNPQFLFEYQAILNEDAVVGQTGNINDVDMYYNYNTNPEPDSDVKQDGNETKVYTWGIDLLKTGDDAVKLSGVEFTLKQGDNDTGVVMNFAQNTDNAYVPVKEGGSPTLTTDVKGKLVIRGLKSGEYTLTETKTASGYVLLKAPITITINGSQEDGTATATVAGETVELINDGDSATALVPMNVVNNTGFDLPKTGGLGVAMFTITGIILVFVSAYFLMTKKKRTEK